MNGPDWEPTQENLPESEGPTIIRGASEERKTKMAEIPIDKIDLSEIGAGKASLMMTT
jgi:hypothetical protein